MSFRSARSTVSSLVISIKRIPSARRERRQEALRIQIGRKEQRQRDKEARKEAEEQLLPYVAAWQEVCDIEEAARIVKDYLLGRLRPTEEYYEQDTAENTADISEEHEVLPIAVFRSPENMESFGDMRQYIPTQNIGSKVAIADHDLRHTRVGLPSGWAPKESLYGRSFDRGFAGIFPIPRQDVLSLDSRRSSTTLHTDSRPGSVHPIPFGVKSRRSTNAPQVHKADDITVRLEDMSENSSQDFKLKFAPPIRKLARTVTTSNVTVADTPECYLDEYYNIHPG